MTYEVACKNVGAGSCGGHIRAETEEEFKSKLADHLAKKHNVTEPNDTLVDFMLAEAKKDKSAAS